MKPLTITLDQIQLKDFIAKTLENSKGISEPGVFSVDDMTRFDLDDIFQYEYDAEDLYSMLIEEEKYLYANFSSSNVDNEVHCVNGETYRFMTQEDYEEYLIEIEEDFEEEDDEYEEDEIHPVQGYYLSEAQSVGFLLKYENDQLHIQSGIFDTEAGGFGGPCCFRSMREYAAVKPFEDLELFEEPMKEYLAAFLAV